MIRKRKVVIIALIAFLTFTLTTNYLLVKLTASQNEPTAAGKDVQGHILKELAGLPEYYKTAAESPGDKALEVFIKNMNTESSSEDFGKLWKVANSWVTKSSIVDLESPYVGDLFLALKKARIIKADVDPRGTQFKLLLTLEGNQEVVFKPRWYEIDKTIEGPVYAGKDRFGAEIVAFYLSAILNIPLTPFSVFRRVSLARDIVPVATKRLLNTTFERQNRTCMYGKCFYCRKEDPVCDGEDFTLPGAVIFNLKAPLKNYRSPWQRTYKKNKKAAWEESQNYCKDMRSKIPKRRLLDLIDTSIFDFLIQNGDRHHYETLYDNVVLLDNGKGLGNPSVHHIDILAPLYQCCSLRETTLNKLRRLSGGKLTDKLEMLPDIKNIISPAHLKALDERLMIVFATVEFCRNRHKSQH